MSPKTKTNGLASFAKTAAPHTTTPKPQPKADTAVATIQKRGRPRVYGNENGDDRQALTFRLRPDQYKRVRQLALDLDLKVQDLVVSGISRLLEERGLEPL